MIRPTISTIVEHAYRHAIPLLALNVPHLPMVEPIARAVREAAGFAMIQVARVEWTSFEAQSLEEVAREFDRCADREFVSLHLDHIPVIDEHGERVDYLSHIRRAIACGYESVMIDGSRLPLEENVRATREVVEVAHASGACVEAEIGSVFGHEDEPPRDYDALFAGRVGFTVPEEAARLARDSGCDWLSVSFGSIHGYVAEHLRSLDKVEARLDLDHLQALRAAVSVPLVLHGGSGIRFDAIRAAARQGIAKVNIGNVIRLAYERAAAAGGVAAGREAVFAAVSAMVRELYDSSIREPLGIDGNL